MLLVICIDLIVETLADSYELICLTKLINIWEKKLNDFFYFLKIS